MKFQVIVQTPHGNTLCDMPVQNLNKVKKVVVKSVFTSLFNAEPQVSLSTLYQRTAKIVGLSERTVQGIVYAEIKERVAA